jgi:hypothetical protein
MLSCALLTTLPPRALAVLVFAAGLTMGSGAVLASGPRLLRYRWVRAKIGLTVLVAAAGAASLAHQFAAAVVLRSFGVLMLAAVLALSVLRPGRVRSVSTGRHHLKPGGPTRTAPAAPAGER